jgi:uncharacterized membrane protein
MVSASLAVDLGVLAADKRTNQKIADLAALDASRDLAGVSAHCLAPPAASGPSCPAVISATRNFSGKDAPVTVSAERVSPNAAGVYVADPNGTSVRVTVSSPRKPYFPFVRSDSRTVTATAIAGAGAAIGTVRVGSSILSASGTVSAAQVPILDRLISSLIGPGLSYEGDVVGWQGLASGSVTVDALASALGTTTGRAAFSAGSPNDVFNATFTMKELLTAMADVLNNNGNSAVATEVLGIKNGINTTASYINLPLKLYDFFDFGGVVVGNKQDVANATLNVYDLIMGSAILANGDNFASFNLAAGDLVGTVIPGGFSGVKVSMSLIEAPKQATGAPGKDALGVYYTKAHTSQLRVKLEVGLNVPLDNAISIVGIGTITNINLTVPYDMHLGRGHAYLEKVNCGASSEPTGVVIKGATDIGTVKLGAVSEADLRAEVANPVAELGVIGSALAGLVQVKLEGSGSTTIAGNPGVDLTFAPPYAEGRPSQPVPGTGVNLPPLTGNATATVLGVLNTGLLNDAIEGLNLSGLVFGTTTQGLNTSIVQPLLDALGLSFGTADVWAPPEQTCAAVSQLPAQPTVVPVLKG